MTRSQNVLAGLLLAGLLAPHAVSAEGYQTRPGAGRAGRRAAHAASIAEPQGDAVLQTHRPGLPAIADVAQPELKLAGLRLNPRMRAASRFDFGSALTLLDVKSGKSRPVTACGQAAHLRQRLVAGRQTGGAQPMGDRGVELWLLDAASARARRLEIST
ncbi:Uncharacterised protein [Chromobacterium violaceum]|uniref:Uncharacterized protein n=1 Tax=Chromobacterium violaceum TaxID=536 RepID=A0A3S4HIK4_CHRVL|nr:Uncharacterised protein [Chromobacterium violaceum]